MASNSYTSDAGIAALAAGPVVATEFRLGSGFGYVPSASMQSLQGTTVLSGIPSNPVTVSPNVYRYRIQLSAATSMEFGEVALYMSTGELLSLTAYSTVQHKSSDPTDLDGVGGHLDVFVQTTGEATVSLQGAKTAPELSSINELPSTFASDINIAVIPDPTNPGLGSIFAYRRNAIWGFDKYDQVGDAEPVVAGTFNQFTINGTREVDDMMMVQFITGPLIGITRRVFNVYHGGGQTTVDLASPLASTIPTGTRAMFLARGTVGSGTGTPGTGGSVNVSDLTTAMRAALGERPTNVATDSLLGRMDQGVDIELARTFYVATAGGTGYSLNDVLVRSNWQTAAGAQLVFWFNATQGQRLAGNPPMNQLTPKPDGGTVSVSMDTPLIASSYLATVAGTGYSVNDVIALSRRVSSLGVATDYWVNLTSGQPLPTAPTMGNLKSINAPQPVRTSRSKTEVPLNANQSTLALAASQERNRLIQFEYSRTATQPAYLKLGVGAATDEVGHDVVLRPGDVYKLEKDEWNGNVEVFSTAAGSLYVTVIR